MPVIRGDASVAMMTVFARIVLSEQTSFLGKEEKSTDRTSACSNRVPNFAACFLRLSISRKPSTPSGNPGKFSTSLVVVSCPPGSGPSMTSGPRLARAAYTAAVRPAQPVPMMTTFSTGGLDMGELRVEPDQGTLGKAKVANRGPEGNGSETGRPP